MKNNLNNPQNACAFDPPRPPRWLMSSHPNSPRALLWLILGQPLEFKSHLARSLGQAYCQVVRQFILDNGNGAILIKGPGEEVERIHRVVRANEFHPHQVLSSSLDVLPLPAEILASAPMGNPRHLIVIGYAEESVSRYPDLLKVVSVDAKINLSHACREPIALGMYAVLVGQGRAEAVAAIEELHEIKSLPSCERADFVKFLRSADSAVPAPVRVGSLEDSLELHFEKSSDGQLAPFIIAIHEHVGPDMAIHAYNCAPRAGQELGAVAAISMNRRKPEVRDRLEQIVREIGKRLSVKARLSWVVGGARHELARLE